MNKVALFALSAAPFLAAGMGVVAAKAIPFWPFRHTEEGFAAGEPGSSCIADVAMEGEGAGDHSAFHKEVDGVLDPWRLDVYANAPDCRAFDVFNMLGRAQCNVQAPARVVYRNEQMGLAAFNIEAPGEHRLRASRHGLSCRHLGQHSADRDSFDYALADAKPHNTFAASAMN